MSDSSKERGEQYSVIPGRVLEVVTITEEDLEKAARIPPGDCPRRYCWWWMSLSFEWNLTPREGCTFLKAKHPPRAKYTDTPCCRADSSSAIDHFECREPQIEADGVDPTGWLSYRAEKNKGL